MNQDQALSKIDQTAELLRKQGRYAEALECMERSLILRQHLYGVESAEVWTACANTGELCNLMAMNMLHGENCNFQQIQDLLDKAVVLTARDREGKAVTFNNLACLCRRQNKVHAALTYLQKTLKIEQKLVSQSSISFKSNAPKKKKFNVADTHINMCAILSQLGRHKAALEHGQAAVQLIEHELIPGLAGTGRMPQEGSLTAQSDRVAVWCIAFHNMGVEQEYLQKISDALQSYRMGLKIAETQLGPQNNITITLRKAALAVRKALEEWNLRNNKPMSRTHGRSKGRGGGRARGGSGGVNAGSSVGGLSSSHSMPAAVGHGHGHGHGRASGYRAIRQKGGRYASSSHHSQNDGGHGGGGAMVPTTGIAVGGGGAGAANLESFEMPGMPLVTDPDCTAEDPPQLSPEEETKLMELDHVDTAGDKGLKEYLRAMFQSRDLAEVRSGMAATAALERDGAAAATSMAATELDAETCTGKVDQQTFVQVLQGSTLQLADAEVSRLLPRIAVDSNDGTVDYNGFLDEIAPLLKACCVEARDGDGGGGGLGLGLKPKELSRDWCAVPPLTIDESSASAQAKAEARRNPQYLHVYWYNKLTAVAQWRDPRPGLCLSEPPPSLADYLIQEFSAADTAGTGELPAFEFWTMLKSAKIALTESEIAELHAMLLGHPETDPQNPDAHPDVAALTEHAVAWSDFVLKAPDLIQRLYTRRAQAQASAAEEKAERRLHQGEEHSSSELGEEGLLVPWCMLPALSADSYPFWYNKMTGASQWKQPDA